MRRWIHFGPPAALLAAALLGLPLLACRQAPEPPHEAAAEPEVQPVSLSVPAPDLPGGTWLNSKPLTWAGLRGKVAVVHFWTFG
jgi:hypothetical protein